MTEEKKPSILQKMRAKRASSDKDKEYLHKSIAGVQNFKLTKRGRLPHGSTYAARYDHGAMKWEATLEIPPGVPGAGTFRGTADGLFYLLEYLDGLYRQKKEKDLADAVKTG